jgi:hypothetical protein
MINLKSILNDNMRVRFEFYRDGALWYSTMNGFQFPVPLNSLHQSVILKATDKATNFSYYIKKHFNESQK